MCMCVYIYIYTRVYTYIYIYIYVERERERESYESYALGEAVGHGRGDEVALNILNVTHLVLLMVVLL